MPPVPRNPFELVVPQWRELPSGLLIPSSVADRIRVDREQPDVLPAELRQDPEPVAVVDEMPLSSDQLAAALNEEELGLEPTTLDELMGTVARLPFEHSFLLITRLAAALWHVREVAQAQIELVGGFDMPVLVERVTELVAQHERRGSRLVVFAEQYITALQRLLVDHARPLDLGYKPTQWDLRSTISAYFSTATIVSAADADLREGDVDAGRWLVYWLKNGLYNARPVMVNEFTRARELFAVLAPHMVDHPEFCPIDEWFLEDYGLTAAEQHSAGFGAYVLSGAMQKDVAVGERSLTAPPQWRGDLEAKAGQANDLLSAPLAWYREQFAELGDDLDTLAWERRPFLRRPFLRLEDGQWLLIAPRAIESWLGEGFLHRAMEAAERRDEALRLRGFLGAVFERYCLDLTRSMYPGERPPGGGRVYGEQSYNRQGGQLTSDVAIDLGPDLVMIEVVARRLTQEMQVFGDREVLERNLAPMLFHKMAQLGRVATDLFDSTATLPDVDIDHVERLWPVLVTAGELMQTEILWDRIDERVRPQSPTFFAELRARAGRKGARSPAQRLRGLASRRPLALVFVTAVLSALIGGVAGSIAAAGSHKLAASPVLAFTPAAGWNTVQSRDAADAQIQFVWAANVPFAGNDSVTGEPTETAKTLPPDGVLVYASSLPSVPDSTGYRDLNLPLSLSDGDFFTKEYENQPAPNVSKYMINAHVNGQYVFVEVLFGEPHPSAQARQAADEELGRLVVPTARSSS